MGGTGLQPLNIFLIVFPFALSATIVAIRVWKKIKGRQLAIEDILLVIAEVFLIALTATVWKLVVVSYAGYHAADIPRGAIDQEQVRLWRYINNEIYNQILGLVKISFLITLLKLRSTSRLIIASLWSLIIINICFVIAATFGSVFMCQPIHKYWQPEVPGDCANASQYIFGVIGVTIGTDVLVALIPAWILYDLQMSLKNKVGVTVLPNAAAEDPHNVRNALSNVEANFGVIAVCGPTIKWILGRFIPYFDTARSTNAFTPDPTSHLRQRSRGYVKSHDGIELQSNAFENTYPRHVRHSCWRADGDDDADSEKQCITVEAGKDAKDIRATTVVEWKSTPSC